MLLVWIYRILLLLTFNEVRSFGRSQLEDVGNYHKSIHLFFSDWMDSSYEKVNFTDKQKIYYNSLRSEASRTFRPGLAPEINIFNLANSRHANQPLLSKFISRLGDISKYLDRQPVRSNVGSRIRRSYRFKLKTEGGPTWKCYVFYKRLSKLLSGSGKHVEPLTKEERQRKIAAIKKHLEYLSKKHPNECKPRNGEAKKENSYKDSPKESEPPKDSPKESMPPDGIPNSSPPPPEKLVAAPPDPLLIVPPTPPKQNEVRPNDAIPTSDPKREGENLRRKKRHADLNRRKNYKDLAENERNTLRSAFEKLNSHLIDDTSEYNIFIKTHRLSNSPDAYSYKWISDFIERFEAALQYYEPRVQMPYLDLCEFVQHNRPYDEWSLSSNFKGMQVTPECSWIGHTLNRHITNNYIVKERINSTLNCGSQSTLKELTMEQYAMVFSLFGSCKARGSHLACPTCAVSDPYFWMINLYLQERMTGQHLVY